jgi:hypothetical protein
MNLQIVEGSDEILLLTFAKNVGNFQFDYYDGFQIDAHEKNTMALIQSFSLDANSLIPVSVTEGEDGYVSEETNETDKAYVKMIGTNTLGKAGIIRWICRPQKTDADFTDNTWDKIYIKDNVSIIKTGL